MGSASSSTKKTGATRAKLQARMSFSQAGAKANEKRNGHKKTPDTRHERNMLMERAYPELRAFCKGQGYEFQVVDMRWGVREHATDDHETTDLCLRELQACQRLSTGPNFVTFISHKYGSRPLPRTITSPEYSRLTNNLSDGDKSLLTTWYRLDTNALPEEFVLQPISAQYAGHLSKDASQRHLAMERWYETQQRLREVLVRAARLNLDPEAREKYLISVTEAEIQAGILNKENVENEALWFHRHVSDIEKAPKTSKDLDKFYDGHDQDDSRGLLQELKTDKIPSKLPDENILKYDIKWSEKGVDPDNKEHQAYLVAMTTDFTEKLKAMITRGIAKNKEMDIDDHVHDEVVQHRAFADRKCQMFTGRDDLLKKMESYVCGSEALPLVISGVSGCGKTSLMARAVEDAWTWTDGRSVVIYRFLGTTEESSSLRDLLVQLTSHLRKTCLSGTYYPANDVKQLVADFHRTLQKAAQKRPLVLFLDSLDQLEPEDGAHQLHWLPRTLPPRMRMVLSTLPDGKYDCFRQCQNLYPEKKCYLEVPKLETTDIQNILQLCYDDAVKWHSYDGPDVTRLYDSITTAINALFIRLERKHGEVLVAHALAYLTATEDGVTEAEIEDLLSLADEVLNDVYQFWTPPVRRLPPLLWVRIRSDLDEYLVSRGVEGVRVVYWYHRHFWEAARRRYLSVPEEEAAYHRELAEFFMGTWSDKPKPYITKKGEQKEALRHVAAQPVRFTTGEVNLRKLSRLPCHLIRGGDLSGLKQHVCCSMEFIREKIRAVSLRAVIEDFILARTHFPKDRDIRVILETLQLSQDALVARPSELAGQIVGRVYGHSAQTAPLLAQAQRALAVDPTLEAQIGPLVQLLEALVQYLDDKNKNLERLLKDAKMSSEPVLLPHQGFLTPPGGQLMHKQLGHQAKVTDLAVANNGRYIATCSLDQTVQVFQLLTGAPFVSVDLPAAAHHVTFTQDDHLLAVSLQGHQVAMVDLSIGRVVHVITAPAHKDQPDDVMPIITCQNDLDKHFLITLREGLADIYNIPKYTLQTSVKDDLPPGDDLQNDRKIITASAGVVAFCAHRGRVVTCISLATCDVTNTIDVFPGQREGRETPAADENHVGALGLLPGARHLVVVNGATSSVHLYQLPGGDLVRSLEGHHNDHLTSIWAVAQSDVTFCCNKHYVTVLDLNNGRHSNVLQHPCKVTKVVSSCGRRLVTIATDNCLRVWDRTLDTFKPDTSSFTGKVTMNNASNRNMDIMQQLFNDVLKDTDEKVPDLREMMTAKEAVAYWMSDDVIGRDSSEEVDTRVRTAFHPFSSELYMGVSQENLTKSGRPFTYCFSVWMLDPVQCIRRVLFSPHRVCVLTVVGDDKLLYCEGASLKTLSLKTWTEPATLSSAVPASWKPCCAVNKESKKIVVESESGSELVVYKFDDAQSVLLLRSETEISSTTHRQLIEDIQTAGDRVIALYNKQHVIVWSLSTGDVIHASDIKTPPPPPPEFSVEIHVMKKHVVVLGGPDTAYGECVVDLDTGKVKGKLHEKSVEKIEERLMVLRRNSKSVLLLGNQNSKVFVLDSCPALSDYDVATGGGDHPLHLVCGRAPAAPPAAVTWTSRVITLWSAERDKLQALGTYTLDDKVSGAFVLSDGRSLLVDSPTGIVKLQMHGRDLPTTKQTHGNVDGLQGIDLNVVFPYGK